MRKELISLLSVLFLTQCTLFDPATDNIKIYAFKNLKVAGSQIPRTYTVVLDDEAPTNETLKVFSEVKSALSRSLSERGYDYKEKTECSRQLIKVKITGVHPFTYTHEYEEPIYGVTDLVTRDKTTYDHKNHSYVSETVVEPRYGITGYRKAVEYHTYYHAGLTLRAVDQKTPDYSDKHYLWSTEILVSSEHEFDKSIFNALTHYVSPYFGLEYKSAINLNVMHKNLMMNTG